MAENDVVLMSELSWYLREHYYRHAINIAQESLKKYVNDATLRLLISLGMVFEDRIQEALRDLEVLKDKQDVNIAALLIMAQAYRSGRVDHDAIKECENKMREQRKHAGERGLFYAGLVTFLMERYEKSREYTERALKIASSATVEVKNLLGWIELLQNRDESSVKTAMKHFEEANEADRGRNVSSLLGKAKCLELRRNFNGGLELLNQVIVGNRNFVPALIEKMRVQLASQEWDQCADTAQRCLDYDPGCVEAMKFKILILLCREGNYQEASREMSLLLDYMDKWEPKNSYQFDAMAVLFSKLSGRNLSLLQQVMRLQDRAVGLSKDNAQFLTHKGRHHLLMGNSQEAMKCFRSALDLDEASIEAVQGIIHCQLMNNMLKEAAIQLEFLNELQSTTGKSADLQYLLAVLARKRSESPTKILQHLTDAFLTHFNILKTIPLSVQFYNHLDPDFLLQIVEEYLHHAPQVNTVGGINQMQQQHQQHPVLKRCQQILDQIVRTVPGLQKALYLLAQVKSSGGDIEGARNILRTCVETDPTFVEAHLLLSQIHLAERNFKLAQQSLETCLSHNFEVRDHPLYHFGLGRIQRQQPNQLKEAIRSLQMALQLCGRQSTGSDTSGVGAGGNRRGATGRGPREGGADSGGAAGGGSKGSIKVSNAERLAIYLELAEAHRMNNEEHEAAKILQDAQQEFAGTPEEIRVTISNADLALQRNDVEMALGILRNVSSEQSYFVEARQRMAQIYLDYRKDKRLYTACYKELVEKMPSNHTYLMLGDAYMDVQEPEKAIEVYEKALKQNPKDLQLATKMGAALTKTHHYHKAISYYEQAVRGGQLSLRHALIELLIKLKHWEKTERVLKDVISQQESATDLSGLMDLVKFYCYLAKVYRGQKADTEALAQLTKSREVQSRILKRASLETPDGVMEQKKLAAQLCREVAQIHLQRRDLEEAVKHYKEALVFCKEDTTAMMELARIHLKQGDLDSAQQQCMQVLKLSVENESNVSTTSNQRLPQEDTLRTIAEGVKRRASIAFLAEDTNWLMALDANGEAASLMMADLMFRKQENDSAIFHCQQLLERKADHYVALSRLVDLMRRNGRLEDFSKFIKKAEEKNPRASETPGYSYCQGLYEWFTGNTASALKKFNHSRIDSQWAEQATYNMVEICLNPDNETLGGEVFDSIEGTPSPGDGASPAMVATGPDQMGLRTAEKLLRELKVAQMEIRYAYLQSMIYMSTKNKASIDRALANLQEVLQKDTENITVQYGIAAGLMMQKQPQKARNVLLKLSRYPWNSEDAEELEKSWLLLADMLIQNHKTDQAYEILRKCLQHNKSCCKAYEYLGFINEKNQEFKEAAKNYELAWKYGNKNSPAIGFKLAFNYLRSQRYVDAVDICHHVLKLHPNYPKIKREILEKARASLRM